MDMKQLIAQIDHIENKQILNEDAHYTAAQVDNRPQVSKSNTQTSIYEMLIKEFGYDVEESTLTENPHANDPAKSAAWTALSPEDQKWLGGADPTDPYILARAPNKGKPAAPAAGGAAQPAPAQIMDPNQADKDDAQMGADMRANAAGGNSTSAATGVGNPGEEAAATAQANAAPAAAQPAPTTGGDTGEVPGVTTQPGATPAAPAGGAAQPAKAAANKSMSPAITAYASRMGLLKNNKPDVAAIKKFQQDNGLKADGIIGPNTAGAILSAQKPGAGGRGGPTAAQAAPAATKPAGGAAQPAPTGKPPRYKTPAEFDKEIDRFSKSANPNLPPNARYIATLQAEKAALSGGAPQPAAPAVAKPALPGQISDTPAAESVKSQDDAILERIRTALFR